LSSNIITLSLSVTNLSSNIISLSSTDINLSGRISTLSSALYPIANQITINTNNTTLNNAKLIIKNSSGHPELQLQGSTTAWGIISLNDNNLTSKARIFAGQGTNIVNFDNTMGGYLFSQNSLERMKLDANGNLSLIGTLSSSTINSLSSNIITLSNTTSNLSSNVFISLSSNIVSLSSNIVTLSSLAIGGSQSLSGSVQSLSTSLFQSGSVVRSIINSPVSGLYNSGTFGPLFFSQNVTTFTTCFTTNYTPLMTLSCVLVAEFNASYTINAYGGDEWESRVLFTWGGGSNNQVSGGRRQLFSNNPGGGTRSGCIFPIEGVFNYFTGGSAPIPMTISIQVRKVSGDDSLTLDGSYFFRLTEIVK
jgi:hypothetical protein